MKNSLPHIVNTLSELHTKLKAEVVVSELKDQAKLTADQIVVRNRSGFKRAYEEDILTYSLSTDDDYSDYLEVELSRNGIYDRLPEGIFHKTTKSDTEKQFADFRRQQKQEQENARLLFAPIENAIFNSEVAIEQQRKKQVAYTVGLEDGFLYNFWGIPDNFPKKYAAPLIRLLPHAKDLAGDLEQTFYALELLLDIKVSYHTFFTEIPQQKKEKQNTQLGVNFILESTNTQKNKYKTRLKTNHDILENFVEAENNQNAVSLAQPSLEVVLHPNKQEGIPNCLKKEGLLEIANVFYDYFIPMEYSITTKISVENTKGFIADKQKGAYLGMSTLLGA